MYAWWGLVLCKYSKYSDWVRYLSVRGFPLLVIDTSDLSTNSDFFLTSRNCTFRKDFSKIKPVYKSVPLQIYFEIAGLASAEKWHKIQNMVGEERF